MNKIIVSLLLLISTSTIADDNQTTVRAFVDAFNAKDINAMLAVTDQNIQWMYVLNDAILIETEGHEQLQTSMQNYFEEYPTSRSELITLSSNGQYVQAIEKASWQDDDDKPRSQCSLSVYKFINDSITHVWYYPAEPCD